MGELIFHLAAGLQRYDPQDTVFADTILKPAQNQFFLFRRKGRECRHVKPKRDPAAHLVKEFNLAMRAYLMLIGPFP